MIRDKIQKYQVQLNMINRITRESDKEEMIIETTAECFQLQQATYVTYEEEGEGNERIKVRLKILSGGGVEIQRIISDSSQMIRNTMRLLPNKTTSYPYRTAQGGMIMMQIKTHDYHFNKSGRASGQLVCHYQLLTEDSEPLGDYDLTLQYGSHLV